MVNAMVDVTLTTIRRLLTAIVPPTVGYASFDTLGLLAGLGIAIVALQVKPDFLKALTVKPPPLLVEIPEVSIPIAAEPCREGIEQLQRWLQECRNDCSTCSQYYRPSESIPCALLAPLKGLFPNGDPYLTLIDYHTAKLVETTALLRENNRLMALDSLRRTPWMQYIQVAFNAIILFGVGQILTYVLASV